LNEEGWRKRRQGRKESEERKEETKKKNLALQGELWTGGLGADAEHDQTTPRDNIHFMRSCRFTL